MEYWSVPLLVIMTALQLASDLAMKSVMGVVAYRREHWLTVGAQA